MFRPSVDDINKLDEETYNAYFNANPPWCQSKNMDIILDKLKSGEFSKGLRMISRQLAPFYSHTENAWITDKRRYMIVGWATIARMCVSNDIPPHERSFYEMMCFGSPCHMFFDFDLDIQPMQNETKTVPLAIVEMVQCMAIVFENERQANPNDPFYQNIDFEKNVTYHITTSNREDKQSSHLIIRLPDNKMFNNFNDIRRIVRAAIDVSVSRYPSAEDSPLKIVRIGPNNMKKHKPIERTIENIIDDSIFNRNRNFRFYKCRKACHPEEVGKKMVLVERCDHHPPCHYTLETCARPDDRIIIDKYDIFYSNCATYVPLDPVTARPIVPFIGRYKREYGDEEDECDQTIISQKKADLARARAQAKAISVDEEGAERSNSKFAFIPTNVTISDFSATKKLVSALEVAIGLQLMCKAKFESGEGTGQDGFLFSLDSKYCPYVERNHTHNHMMVSVLIKYPRPILFYKCHNELLCKEAATGVKQNKVVEPLYDAIWDEVTPAIEAFLLHSSYDCKISIQ